MKYFVLFAVIAACFAFDKESMLKHNKISKEAVGAVEIKSTCDECQALVRRFSEAAKDPKKLAELKMLLNVLCHETSYVDECRVFVSKLDVIVKKLEPYLQDAHRVCKSFHMCSNSRLDAFHRIGLLYAKRGMNKVEAKNDLVCDECQFAAKELKTLVEDKEKQQAIREFFSQNVCKHIPRYQGMCDMLVEQFLPEMFQELDSLLQDPKKACADIGFCPRMGAQRKLTPPHVESSLHPAAAFFEAAKAIQTPTGSILMSCLECKLAVEEVISGLIAERNATSAGIQNLACHDLLPSNFTAGCDDFLSLYLPTVLYMTYEQFTPEGVCKEMKSCDSVSLVRMSKLSKSQRNNLKCKSCAGVQEYFKTAVDRPETARFQRFVISELKRSACDYLGDFATTCDRFVDGVIPRMFAKFFEISKSEAVCSKIHPGC
ncbi:surfactant protein B [Ancylostoma caninum]|uniref:Surfactant protein B n=1 Tax=Ancylostoma caninum TaxID=29170 RepID=A0A368FME1_ANCCA|nr:surfactant protein B [Ancylostoma caninum]